MNVLASGVSALQAYSRVVETHAVNLANSQTPGYTPSRTLLAESPKGGVTASVGKNANPGPSVDMAGEIVGLVTAEKAYEANAKSIRVADEMAGSILDIIA